MKHFIIRSQLVFVSIILLLTLGMMLALVMRHNQRWDFTREKVYSISDPTARLLRQLEPGVVDVLAFYPNEDPLRRDFEIFLKECQRKHSDFKYQFFDPDRVPRMASELRVKDLYTVIIRYGGRQERIVRPNEQAFASALARLADPREINLCFVTGHNEASLVVEDRSGLKVFKSTLEDSNYKLHEIILARDKVPELCDVIVLAGPHRDLDQEEWGLLKEVFNAGKGIFFLIDPMDPGTGKMFQEFMKAYGLALGADVIVDKMSRMVGGDFLVPLVSQYLSDHPITEGFDQPTFFPVARSVQPSVDQVIGIEAVPIAFSGTGSWGETDLVALEKGEASFQSDQDVAGPICLAAAAEQVVPMVPPDQAANQIQKPPGGRIVVVGDSDFMTNIYVDLYGNKEFALRMISWLAKDTRSISLQAKHPEFKPLILNGAQRLIVLSTSIGAFPLLVLAAGAIRIFWRRKTG